MNSDDFYDDLDAAALEQIDALESAAFSRPNTISGTGLRVSGDRGSKGNPLSIGEDSFDLSFNFDEGELQRLDPAEKRPQAGPSRLVGRTIQTTLDGGFVTSSQKPPNSKSVQGAKSPSDKQSGLMAPKTKKWDHTAFAKTGIRIAKKAQARGKAIDTDGWGGEQPEYEFVDQSPGKSSGQLPAPFMPSDWPPPMKLEADLLEAKHWIYPLNKQKRDYQFNIVKNCLFENTLVALPTGLGKTFVAGVVMLNYYRWFPQGKVIFVAPSKPLVSQQINACHKVCGIPGTEAVELTGQVPPHVRKRWWEQKRIFYMTPQTLVNDIISENCDVRDIVLLVIDEAHHGSGGGYAYNQIIGILMSKNPHFRVLALTATPGGTPEALQNLINGLHISHVEIRDERSLDIVPYIHDKKLEKHIITMNDDVNRVKDMLVGIMDPLLQKLKPPGILPFGNDLVKMHHFYPQSKCRELRPHEKWACQPLSRLSAMARAMGYLMEGTMNLCHTYLVQLSKVGEPKAKEETAPAEGGSSPRKKRIGVAKELKTKIQWRNDVKFKALLAEMESQRSRGFAMHPKMEVLRDLLISYFGQRMPDEAVDDEDVGASNAMVFANSREVVDEIVEMLEAHRPLVRASRFIGQGLDKQGKKGMAQKMQLETIQKFQANEINVLVATSIGEEGLDIGEVDLIICYDAQKTPIRMLQRFGRTGRQRDGTVHVLLAENREELNVEKAKASYKEVQRTIYNGNQIDLYGDVERLLPGHIKPQCLEKEMPITPYVPEPRYSKKAETQTASSSKAKRKRNVDVQRNIPALASMGFIRASDLNGKSTKKRKIAKSDPFEEEKDFDMQGVDDDTDKELESEMIIVAPRRTKSSVTGASKPKTERKPRLRKAATHDGGSKSTKSKKKAEKVEEFASSSNSRLEVDDSDMDIGPIPSLAPNTPDMKKRKAPVTEGTPSPTKSSQGSPKRAKRETGQRLVPSSADSVINLIDSEHEDAVDLADSHPPSTSQHISDDLSWVVQDDDEMDLHIASSPLAARGKVGESAQAACPGVSGANKGKKGRPVDERSMGWNGAPHEFFDQAVTSSSPGMPIATFPVQRAGKGRNIQWDDEVNPQSSPCKEAPLKRLQRHPPSSTPMQKKRKQKMTALEAQHNPLFDVIANHSGDEVSEGRSGTDDDVESESDRAFIKNSPLTQVPGSYDQSRVYRQSLFTQVPGETDIPKFVQGPVRPNSFGRQRARQVVQPSSSPAKGSDDYEFGSFVVRDDADVSYEA